MSSIGSDTAPSRKKNWSGAGVFAIIERPHLWFEALRALTSMSRGGRIQRGYISWRTATAYGTPSPVTPEDLVAYLQWRRRMRSAA